MELSQLQRKTLEQYSTFRDHPPSVRRLMALAARSHVRLVIVVVFGIFLTGSFEMPSMAYFLIGLAVGTISRDLGMFRKHVHVWPAIAKVLDWKRVDALLANHAGERDKNSHHMNPVPE